MACHTSTSIDYVAQGHFYILSHQAYMLKNPCTLELRRDFILCSLAIVDRRRRKD